MTARPCSKGSRRLIDVARCRDHNGAKGTTRNVGAGLAAKSRIDVCQARGVGAQDRAAQRWPSLLYRLEECHAMPTPHLVAARRRNDGHAVHPACRGFRGGGGVQQTKEGAYTHTGKHLLSNP